MADQFRAAAGVDYVNPATGQKVNYSAQDLANPAIGFLSSQFVKASDLAPKPAATAPAIAPGVTAPTSAPTAAVPVAPAAPGPTPTIPSISAPAASTAFDFKSLVGSPEFTGASAGTIFRLPTGQQFYKTSGGGLSSISNPTQLQDLARQGLVIPNSDVYIGGAQPQSAAATSAAAAVPGVESANAALVANADFVNAAFSAYHGRNATAAELQKFVGMPVGSVRDIVKGGAPSSAKSVSVPPSSSSVASGSIPGVIDSGSVPSPDLSFPSIDTSSDPFLAAIKSLYNDPSYAAAASAYGDAAKTIADSSNALLGKATRQTAVESSLGIPQSLARIQEINGQIANLTAATSLGDAKILDQPIPANLLYGQQAAFDRQQMAKIGALQAEREALSGNVQLAMQIADRTVNLEFAPYEQAIANAKDFLSINGDVLNRMDAKRAEQMNLILGLRAESVAAAKENKSQNLQLMLQVAQSGGDTSVIKPDAPFAQNLAAATPYLRNPQIKTQVVDVGGRKVLIDEQTGATVKDLGPSDGSVKTSLVDTPDGQLLINSATGDIIKNFGTAKDQQTRIDNRANQLADNFTAEPQVRAFNVVAAGYATVQSIADDTKSPSDDQALIYGFAKAMDPTSVVREGEYATVQKYAQAWIETFGFNAQRILDNKEFLTPDSIRNIKATIGTKYNAMKQQYDVILNSYAGQINRVTGQQDGKNYLIDYSQFDAANPKAGANASGAKLNDQQQTWDSITGGTPDVSTVHGVDATGTDHLAEAIGQVESGGRYNARGVVIPSGSYKGDRAYGKYQIMGLNIPGWTKAALGVSMTPEQFLNDPHAQDLTARFHIAQLLGKYGNPDDVASAWFTGGPLSKNRAKSDANGTTAERYVAMVRSAFANLS